MGRTKTRRNRRIGSATVKAETVDWFEEIEASFEDGMPRGDVIDMMVDYVRAQKLEDEIFGPSVPTGHVRKNPGEDDGTEDEDGNDIDLEELASPEEPDEDKGAESESER